MPDPPRRPYRMRLDELPLCTACGVSPATCACAEHKRMAFVRTSHEMLCTCGRTYLRHPPDPAEPWLTILCNGERAKL